MDITNYTKKNIVALICHYDCRFIPYMKKMLKFDKNVLINVYCIVLLDHISSSITRILACQFDSYIKSFYKDLDDGK